MRKVDPALHERLETLIQSMGCELVGVELLPEGKQLIFRVYIDKAPSLTIDDCSRVSYQVGAMLDVDGTIEGRYRLEVSSPGINRPLFEIKHYQQFISKCISVKLHLPVNQRRNFKGVLLRVDGDDIYLLVEGMEHELRVPFSAIEKANLIGDLKF